MIHEILCERHSTSDEQIICVEVSKIQGEKVIPGDVLFELEGAKAIFEVIAPTEGFFSSTVKAGDILQIGQVIAVLSTEEILISASKSSNRNLVPLKGENTTDISFTTPAQKIFNSLDRETQEKIKSQLNISQTYNSEQLQKILANCTEESGDHGHFDARAWKTLLEETRGDSKLVLIGGGYGALQTLDIVAQHSNHEVIGYFSDSETNLIDQLNIPKLGDCTQGEIENYVAGTADISFVISVGMSPTFRFKIYSILKTLGVNLPNFLDKSVVIARNVKLGEANLIFANCFIGVDTEIGNANFISSNSTIEHHNKLGDANCFGPNLVTSGVVKIGSACRFGAGVIIEPKLQIGDRVIVASNATVTRDLTTDSILKVRL